MGAHSRLGQNKSYSFAQLSRTSQTSASRTFTNTKYVFPYLGSFLQVFFKLTVQKTSRSLNVFSSKMSKVKLLSSFLAPILTRDSTRNQIFQLGLMRVTSNNLSTILIFTSSPTQVQRATLMARGSSDILSTDLRKLDYL